MTDVHSRVKDIIFTDKEQSLEKISKLVTRHINLLEILYDIFK
jgi:NTE family protein